MHQFARQRYRGDFRATPGVAVVSTRMAVLNRRLDESLVSHRWLVMAMEADRGVIPPFRPPLLLDAVGLPPLVMATILRDMSVTVQPVPTIILLDGADPVAKHLARGCSAAILVITDDSDLSVINAWLRVRPVAGPGRWANVPAAWVGASPPPLLCDDVPLVEVLAALSHAATMEEASAHACVSPRTFASWRALLRERLHLPPTPYRPLAFAHDIVQSLREAPLP